MTQAIQGYTSPPARPSREQAEEAQATLLASIASFPFITYGDRAGVLAHILTCLIRRSLPAAPMFVYTAPSAGTGKTKAASTGPVIATGREPSVLSLGADDAETEKRLGGAFMAGDPCINWDNLTRPIGNQDFLNQALSQPRMRIRPLGGSGMLDLPTHATQSATANNASVVGDLKRRVVLIRLDAGMERPEQRHFDRDHLADVLARRGELIRAALTIPLAYRAAGAPETSDLPPFGGFEHWDRMVRRPLVWIGLPDPLAAAEGLREADPDLEAMRLLLGAWSEVVGSRPVTVAEVIASGMATHPNSDTRMNPELYEGLQIACSEKPNPRRLGYWLRSHRDRISEGLRLRQATRDHHAKVARWIVERCG